MYVKLNGEMVYLWRAVDQEGEILESYITKTRDKAAAGVVKLTRIRLVWIGGGLTAGAVSEDAGRIKQERDAVSPGEISR